MVGCLLLWLDVFAFMVGRVCFYGWMVLLLWLDVCFDGLLFAFMVGCWLLWGRVFGFMVAVFV